MTTVIGVASDTRPFGVTDRTRPGDTCGSGCLVTLTWKPRERSQCTATLAGWPTKASARTFTRLPLVLLVPGPPGAPCGVEPGELASIHPPRPRIAANATPTATASSRQCERDRAPVTMPARPPGL